MQPLPEYPMPARNKSYQRKQYVQDRRKSSRAAAPYNPGGATPEPFSPAYGCVEWFIYEETAQRQRAGV